MKTFSLFAATSRQSVARRAFESLAATLCLILFVGVLSAQEYKEANVDESLASQKSSVIGSGDSAQIKEFLTKYYLARWTVRANGRDLSKYRTELEQDAVELSGDAQTKFLQEVVGVLKSYAGSSSCYPACRYNAALTIGTLNISNEGGKDGLPKPYPDAITVLAKFCTTSSDVPDYIRYAGLIGLVRHAQCGIEDAKYQSGVKSVFAKVLDPKYAVDNNIRDEIYECFAEEAITGLASFKSPTGTKGGTGTLDLFRRTIEDKNASFELRCIAAKALGDMDLSSLKNYDYAGLAKSLVTLARDFCVEESSYIDSELVRDQVKSASNSMTGGGMGSGMGSGMGGGMSGGMGGMDMSGGMGGSGMGGGGMGGGMNGTIQNQKSMEAIVARVQYGFECIRRAISGSVKVKKGETNAFGILSKFDEKDEKQAETIQMLKDALTEFESTNTFVKEGPKSANAYGGMTGMTGMGMTGYSTLNVDANSMKDHLLEKKIRFNELLGINSYR